MSEETDRFELAASGFDQRVRAVPAGKWDAQSPCEQWTARDVVAHIVGNYRSIAAEAAGGESKAMGADEEPTQAWSDAYDRMRVLVSDPDMLAKTVNGPTGPAPFEQIVGSLVALDTHVHTWDLARAVGGDERLDENVCRFARGVLEPMDQMIRQPGVFGPKLEPPSGADEQTQLLYFLGRRA
ncbi:MAG: TIGR03086 family protein [Acidimicrobiaceae bacterium]|nr:TIGR03086 family protein [Acidimicrobiaceae bacterium]